MKLIEVTSANQYPVGKKTQKKSLSVEEIQQRFVLERLERTYLCRIILCTISAVVNLLPLFTCLKIPDFFGIAYGSVPSASVIMCVSP